MRRLITRIAILAVCSLGFIGITGATPASAGNCTAITFNNNGHPNPIWYDGKWAWNPTVGNCTGVNGIEFMAWSSAYPGFPPFLYDATFGAYHFPTSGGGACLSGGTITSCSTFYRNPVWGGGCGAPPMWVTAYYQYRIRSTPGTWGPWHSFNSSGQWIC